MRRGGATWRPRRGVYHAVRNPNVSRVRGSRLPLSVTRARWLLLRWFWDDGVRAVPRAVSSQCGACQAWSDPLLKVQVRASKDEEVCRHLHHSRLGVNMVFRSQLK